MMKYNFEQSVEHLAQMGAELVEGTSEEYYSFYYSLTIKLSVIIDVKFTGEITCKLQSSNYGFFTLTNAVFSTNFGLHEYIKQASYMPAFDRLEIGVKEEYNSWLMAYSASYTFESFKEAVKNKVNCAFVLPLSYELELPLTMGKRVYNTISTFTAYYDRADVEITTYFSLYDRDIYGVTPVELLQMDSICELLNLTSGVPDADAYCRKCTIDNLLQSL